MECSGVLAGTSRGAWVAKHGECQIKENSRGFFAVGLVRAFDVLTCRWASPRRVESSVLFKLTGPESYFLLVYKLSLFVLQMGK